MDAELTFNDEQISTNVHRHAADQQREAPKRIGR
jgi:hypothetical protein